MIRWAQPVYLWFLLLVPAAAAAALLVGVMKRRRLARAVDRQLIPELTPAHSRGLTLLKNMLLVAGFAFLLISAARPKWGERLQIYKGKGIDVVIALDASKSMLAEDVKPNRLGRAKTELAALIDGLAGNAVGITAFAGESFVMCPLTTDMDAAKLFLDIIGPDMMPVPGTDFGKAIDVSLSLFNPKERNYKALVMVTDGEDMGKNTGQAVQRAVENRVRIFPVAISTPEGAPIPEYDENGNLSSYKKDKEGQIVMSRMNERQLILLAKATDGRFLRVEGFSAERLIGALDEIRKKDIGGGQFTDYVERYQVFLMIALVLFLAALGLSNRRGSWLPKGLFMLVVAFGLTGVAHADVRGLMRKGNGLYSRQKFEEALDAYQQAEVLEPDATAIHYNLGNALYRLGRFQEAVSEMELVLTDKDHKRRADAMYNMGNAVFKAGQLEPAIKAYTAALVMNPDDMDAKQNLEFCLKKLEEQKNQPQSDSSHQDQEQQQQPQPRQQQQQMSPDQAERVLQALEGKEKEEQEKVHQAGQEKKVEKDW
jgi:Ca-activated chloride channel family protein